MSTTAVPAVEGWFTTDEVPHLLGTRCTSCSTVFFPRASGFCRNPDCRGREFTEIELARTGTVWSYTDAQYQPPPPYIPPTAAHEPFALGGCRAGRGADRDPRPGRQGLRRRRPGRRLRRGAGRRTALRARRRRAPHLPLEAGVSMSPPEPASPSSAPGCTSGASGAAPSTSTASRRRWPPSTTPASAGATCSSWRAARPCATATPATSPRRRSRRRWAGTAPASATCYAACASGVTALDAARARDPRRAVRRRPRGRRRHHAQGLPRAGGRGAVGRPRLAAVPPARRHQPDLLRPLRPSAHGPLRRHRRRLRQGEGQERPPRPAQPVRPVPQGGHRGRGAGLADGGRPAAAARDLRHL